MNFTVDFSPSGVPTSGLTLTIQIWQVSDGADVTPVSPLDQMTEVGTSAFYKFPFTTTDTEDYVARADGGAVYTSQRYAPCITEVQGNTEAILEDTNTNLDATVSSRAIEGDAMTLEADAITAGSYDESTAFPVKSEDTGDTQIARKGADSDTLETLSDQLDAQALINTEARLEELDPLNLPLDIDAIQTVTDKINFSVSDDIKATLDGELVTTDTASRDASKANITGLATLAKQNTMQTQNNLIEQIVGGDWTIAADQLIYYTASHVELFRFDLTLDVNDNPIARNRTDLP